jgi:signal peptidase I
MNLKEVWKKFWHLLWVDESLKGWIFALVFLFIFVRLILFPLLSIVTGTALPLAIVESCSMYHKPEIPLIYDFDKWWQNHEEKYTQLNITKEQFKKFTLKNGFSKGDILFSIKAKPQDLKVGDIIMFQTTKQNPLIHRIINIRYENNEYIFTTIGDNNKISFTATNNPYWIDEINIKENQLVGKAVFKIAPYLGWSKLIFFEHSRTSSERGLCKED